MAYPLGFQFRHLIGFSLIDLRASTVSANCVYTLVMFYTLVNLSFGIYISYLVSVFTFILVILTRSIARFVWKPGAFCLLLRDFGLVYGLCG